jgi:hypothetical protein
MSDMACNGKAGVTCADDETQVTCALVAGTTNCFKITAGSAVTCSTNKSCPGANVGCVCDDQPACDGAANGGAGTYCDPANAPQGRYSCAAAADGCVIPGDAADCADPTVCAEATAGAATCVCPAAGTEEGTGCGSNTNIAPICSADNNEVLHCTTVGACNVWTVTSAEDDCIGQGGLVCENADCVCPETANEKTFFADPNVTNRPASLLPTGARFPAICTFPTLTLAHARAKAESLGFFRAYAVASADSTPAGQPVMFRNERPFDVGPTESLITTHFPGICGSNCPGIDPTRFVIEANNFSESSSARGFIHLRGNADSSASGDAAQGPSLIGFTIQSAPCAFASDPLTTNCAVPESLVWSTGTTSADTNLPNMAFNILNGTGGGLSPLLAKAATSAFQAFAGFVPGGTLTDNEDGTFTYEFAFAPDPNDTRFKDGNDPGSGKGFAEQEFLDACTVTQGGMLALSITGTLNGANDGFYFLDPNNGGDDDTLVGIGNVTDEDLTDSALVALWCLNGNDSNGQQNIGHLVDHANGVFETSAYLGFISGAGVKVEGTFGSGVGAVYSGGGWAGNLYGMYVIDWEEGMDANAPRRNTKVTVQGAPITNTPALFSGNLLVGAYIRDNANSACNDVNDPLTKANVDFTGTGMVVENTYWARNPTPDSGVFEEAFEEGDYGLGTGFGIVIGNTDYEENWAYGNPTVTLTNVEVGGNQIDGAWVYANDGCEADMGKITVTTSTFDGNRRDGFHIEYFHGPVTIAGGSASGNGYNNPELDNGDFWSGPYPAVQGNGVTVNGCVSGYANNTSCLGGFTLTSSGEGEAGRLQLAGNVVSGLWVDGSSVYVKNTDLTGNGTGSHCDDPNDFTNDFAGNGPALYVQDRDGGNDGFVHLYNTTITGNLGTGAFFNSYSDNADRPNTLSGVTISNNQANNSCSFGFNPDNTSWWLSWENAGVGRGAGGGMYVTDEGRVEATDDGVTVSNNVRKGVYNNGTVTALEVERETEEKSDPNTFTTEVGGEWTITGNGGTGWYDDDSIEATILGGEISGNGAGTDANDPSQNNDGGGFFMGSSPSFTTTVTLDGTLVTGNTGQGVRIETCDDDDRVEVVSSEISSNTSHGVYVLGAPGFLTSFGAADNDITLVPLNVTGIEYGFVLDKSTVTGNMGDGVHLGKKSAQECRVLAQIGGSTTSQDIFSNVGNGLVMEQTAPGGAGNGHTDDGATGATVTNNRLRENGKAGFELWTSVIVPFDTSGLGFKQNLVNHNAMSAAGCVATQTAPQIFIRNPTAIDGTACAAIGTEGPCGTASTANMNSHCIWTQAGNCRVSHDLRGSLTTQGCADANKIFGYSTGPGPLDVGARAEASDVSTPSVVDLRNNNWVGAPKTTVGGGSTIATDPSCGGIGCTP